MIDRDAPLSSFILWNEEWEFRDGFPSDLATPVKLIGWVGWVIGIIDQAAKVIEGCTDHIPQFVSFDFEAGREI